MFAARIESTTLRLLAAACLVAVLPQSAQGQNAEIEAVEPQADCALLEDPDKRERIGGALESKLKMLCEGPAGRAVDGPPGIGPAEIEEESAEVRKSRRRDVLVNDPGQDNFPNTTQSETSIAAVGRRICAAWNDSGQFVEDLGFAGFGVSPDTGKTWKDRGPFPPGVGGRDLSFGDPSLAYSVRDRTFYYASLSSAGLSLWGSGDQCRSFEYVRPIHIGGGDDKELIAVDNNRHSPYFGRIHVGWTNFSLADDLNQTSYSDDGGATWSAAVSLPGSGVNGQGMWPAVAPNGDVYFALLERCFEFDCLQAQRIYKSVNGGDTWFEVAPIGENQLVPLDVDSTLDCGRQALNGNIRNLSSPQIAIHRKKTAPAGYVIHAVYPYDSDGAGPDESNVFYRRSVNGGLSWSAEVQLNDDRTTTDQWYPALGVNRQGVVVVSWYDRRVDPANNLKFARFANISWDHGKTWGRDFRVSAVVSPVAQTLPNFDPAIVDCYHGDYDQIAVSRDVAHIVWSDDRRVTAQGPNPDVYAKTIALKRPRHRGVVVAAK
jgi:hypothetical protein